MNKQERLEVAATIIRQLGSKKFCMMVGAKDILATDSGVRFKIGRNPAGVNMVLVDLTPMDLYNIKFEKRSLCKKTWEAKRKEIASFEGAYAEDLADLFTSVTKLYTSL